jgi:signal transduction histidine kinase
MTHSRLIGIAGLVACFLVATPAVLYHFVNAPTGAPGEPLRNGLWIAVFALFGILFAVNLRRPRLPFLVVESLAAVVLALSQCNGYEGTLLVLVAIQLATCLARTPGLAWILAQTLLLGAALAIGWNFRVALLLVPPYLGFQVVAFLAFHLLMGETAARTALAAANAELRAVQEILADSSRMAERLRIAHELHDALGHRLTALSLNLEAARLRAEGPIRERIDVAQGLARDLLADVRSIVSSTEASRDLHFESALQELVRAVPRPQVHLEIPGGFHVEDPERARVLLRCAQEIMTNAARHSAAENLWIVIDRRDGVFRIEAHDDGRGSEKDRDGFGIRGMRARLEEAGGELHVATTPGRGFHVRALLPDQQAAG